MKSLMYRLLILSLLLPFTAQAQVLYGGGTGTVSNATINGTAGTVETLPTITDTIPGVGSTNAFTSTNTFSGPVNLSGTDTFSGNIQTQGIVFSSDNFHNPLTFTRFFSATTAQVNAGQTIINSVSGRTIFPGNFMIMASGSATGNSVVVECTDAVTVIASFATSALTTFNPVLALSSSVLSGNRSVLASGALVQGCPSGQGIMISTFGAALSVTNNLFISMPYTVQ